MKRCPECRRDYFDDTLFFCLDDGTALLEGPASSEEKTMIFATGSTAAGSAFGSQTQAPVFQVALPKLSQVTFSEAIEQYPAWSPDGGRLAFSRDETGIRSIFVKNVETGEEDRLTEGSFDDIQPSWSPDGKTIVFVRARQSGAKLEPGDVFGLFLDGDVWALDIETRKETRLIEKAFNPEFSPDGSRIAFDGSLAGPRRIWTVDRLGHNPQQITSDSSEGISHVRPRWSPDGTRIVFQNIDRTKFDIRVVDLATGRYFSVTDDAVQDLNPVWSASGRFIYYSSYRGGGINIWRSSIMQDGSIAGPPQQMTLGAGQDVEIAISPDCKRLAFSILRQNADIWRLPVSPETGRATAEPEEVITTTREDSRGAWSPNGKFIAFNSDRTGEMNIWLHNVETGQSKQLTKGGGGDFQANWSPDQSRIVFFSSRAGTADIWCIEVETGKLEQLTATDSVNVNPFYSPDGNMIAYNSDETGRPEVWVMNADGSEPRQLSNTGVMGHFMRWNETGDAIIYRSPGGGSAQTVKIGLDGSAPVPLAEVAGGAHMSFSPDHTRIMDVVGHKVIWVSPLSGGKPEKVFEFEDPEVRIDYPVWSPDGHWVLFDRFRPSGGDIWMMENFEQ